MAFGTLSTQRSSSQATALTGQVLGGNVQFVDALELTSFIGLGGFHHTAPGPAKGSSVIPIAGTLMSFSGQSVRLTTGTLTFTVFVNNAASLITCTIPTGDRTCSSAATAVIPAGATVAVQLQNGTTSFVTDVRWSAVLSG